MSQHEVNVININNCKVEKHPNADTLSTVEVFGYTALVRTADINPSKPLWYYVEPDYVVPDTQEFAFLQGKRRIKTKKLRGLWSQGLLMPAPKGVKEGDNIMDLIGVTKYEPPARGAASWGGGTFKNKSLMGKPPKGYKDPAIFGLEHYRKNKWAIKEGEQVNLREKLHGCCASYIYLHGKMYVKSHRVWRDNPNEFTFWEKLTKLLRFLWNAVRFRKNYQPAVGKCAWWLALEQNPWIEKWCKANPGRMLFGEIYGDVQDLTYGKKPGELGFAAFAVLEHNNQYWGEKDFTSDNTILEKCPLLYTGPFSQEELLKHVDGKSMVPGAKNIREGVVISTLERSSTPMKYVSDAYLERSKD